MIKFVRIIERGAGPKIAKRKLNKVLRAAWVETGRFWHEQFSAKHFTQAGAKEYGYAPRKGQRFVGDTAVATHDPRGKAIQTYSAQKKRLKGHVLPLVWSGDTRQLARFRTLVATKSKVKIKTMARAINFRTQNTKINMLKEFQTISRSEEVRIVKTLDVGIQRGFDGLANERLMTPIK